MRRFIVVASLALALIATSAAPVAATETFHFRGQGNWAYAAFTNVVFDGEQIPPGDYFYTDVWASQSIQTGDATYNDGGVCVFSETFSIDADGNWVGGTWFGTCGPADLSIARRLTGAALTASILVEDCVDWDKETGECLELATLGTLNVDLAFVGTGPTYRYHGTSSGGSAGYYQYVQHGTALGREATAGGTLTLTAPDESVTDLTFGVDGYGAIQQSRDGYVEVIIGG